MHICVYLHISISLDAFSVPLPFFQSHSLAFCLCSLFLSFFVRVSASKAAYAFTLYASSPCHASNMLFCASLGWLICLILYAPCTAYMAQRKRGGCAEQVRHQHDCRKSGRGHGSASFDNITDQTMKNHIDIR